MSVGFPFFDPRIKPLDSNGLPQAGCYYCFFVTGTLTPTNVYADGALTTPLSQPTPGSVNPSGGTVADSAGRFAVMYNDPSVTYRAQLYSAAGTLLEDTDPYKVPGSAAVTFGNGTAASPGMAFTNYLATGLYIPSSNSLGFATNGIAAGAISQSQAWSIPAATGADTFTLAGASGFNTLALTPSSSGIGLAIGSDHASGVPGLRFKDLNASAQSFDIGLGIGNDGPYLMFYDRTNGLNLMALDGTGCVGVFSPPNTGSNLPAGSYQVGYLDAPLVQIGASTAASATWRGKSLQFTGGSSGTLTLPNVGFPSGAMMIVINLSGNSWTLAASGTLTWLQNGSATTGSRTLAANGTASVYCIAGNWYVWGQGIS